jgi:hypothetical protein
MATHTEQMKEIVKDLTHIAETIFGNGKPGLRELTESNIRDIASNAKLVGEMIEVRKLETQARTEETKVREAETLQRQSDTRKWWRGQAASVITAILVVIQTATIAWLLTHLPK